jgi:hypothetical protein
MCCSHPIRCVVAGIVLCVFGVVLFDADWFN